MCKGLSRNILLFILIAILSFSSGALAKRQRFSGNHTSFSIDVPDNWQIVEELYGVPFMILGPKDSSRRPTLSIIPTGIDGVYFDSSNSFEIEKEYKKGREEWLEKKGGKSISYLPYAAWPPLKTIM